MKIVHVSGPFYECVSEPIDLENASYLAIEDLAEDKEVGKKFWDKMADVLFQPGKYIDKSVEFAKNLQQFLEDWEFISLKQYYSFTQMYTRQQYSQMMSARNRYRGYSYSSASSKSRLTDMDLDTWGSRLFGDIMFPEEAEGMIRRYRDDGSRYWTLPELDKDFDSLCDIPTEGYADRLLRKMLFF